MPNPVGDVPGLWAATWVLQVMPVFFFVGGYANLAGWQAVTREGGGAARFLRSRMRRLLGPLVPWLGCWVVVDLAWQAAGGPQRPRLGHGRVRPPLVPGRVRRGGAGRAGDGPAARPLAVAGAGGARPPPSLARRRPAPGRPRSGGAVPGLVGSACVWLFCHQLGYFWRDGTLVAAGGHGPALLVAAGLGGLVALTARRARTPPSMVAVRGGDMSNMFPTTACIAALATFQLGLVLLVRPRLDAWLQRRGAVAGRGGRQRRWRCRCSAGT